MCNVIMVGCDLHDASMVLKVAVGTEASICKEFSNTFSGRKKLITWLQSLQRRVMGRRIVFGYEASGQGFGLYDQLGRAGIECYVLAPSHLPKRPYAARRKTDERDAEMLLKEIRAYVLAGNELPTVWVPDPELRDDRELVRTRLETAEKRTMVLNQIKSLLKRNYVEIPTEIGTRWTRRLIGWLEALSQQRIPGLKLSTAFILASLLRQAESLRREIMELDTSLLNLLNSARYRESAERLLEISGVGVVTAMVFLTELGDLSRFRNRRQLAAYLGLVPASHESGSQSDRKGHITRQGPARVRKVLCQAVWSRLRHCSDEQARHRRIAGGRPSGKKKATVACMRQLAIRMWHRCQPSSPPSRCAVLRTEARTSALARQKGTVPLADTIASAPSG